MSPPCTHCGAALVVVDDIPDLVCSQCGALADPSQTVLADTSNGPTQYLPQPALTLKSIRSGNWNLAGQEGKESRDRKNTFAIAAYINSLAVSLNATGLSPRAITLFSQARSAASFRWGKPARSVAGASLAIALREAGRPDSLRDIADITGTPYLALTRAFRDITVALRISIHLVDPSVHLTAIHDHLAPALQDRPSNQDPLPVALVNQLRPVSLHAVNHSATQLSRLLARLAPEHEVSQLPGLPTACAIFILALESELRATLSNLTDLANYLAVRLHSTKSTILSRYKLIQDQVAIWVEHIPWLDKYEVKQQHGRSKGGRAKVAKRLVVARGIKDVIAFQESEWLKKPRPELNLIEEEAEDRGAANDPQTRAVRPSPFSTTHPRKRRRLNNDQDSDALAHARRFLIDPLTPLSSASSSTPLPSPQNTLSKAIELLLTLSSPNPSAPLPRTRLQRLALERGGSTQDRIPDDDLFEPGELENLLRSSDEIGVLKEHFDWSFAADGDGHDEDDETSGSQSKAASGTKVQESRRKGAASRDTTRKGTSRINVDALAQFYQTVDADIDSGPMTNPSPAPLSPPSGFSPDSDNFEATLMGLQGTMMMVDEGGDGDGDSDYFQQLISPPTSTPTPNTLQEDSDPDDDEQARNVTPFSRGNTVDADPDDEADLNEWWASSMAGGSRSANTFDDECRYEQEYD